MSNSRKFFVEMDLSGFAHWAAAQLVEKHLGTRHMEALISLCDLPSGELYVNDLRAFFESLITAVGSTAYFDTGSAGVSSEWVAKRLCGYLVDNECPVSFTGDTDSVEDVDVPAQTEKPVTRDEIVTLFSGTPDAATIREAFDIAYCPSNGLGDIGKSFRREVESVTEIALESRREEVIGDILAAAAETTDEYYGIADDNYTLLEAVSARLENDPAFADIDVERANEALVLIEDISAKHPLADQVAEVILSPYPAVLKQEEAIRGIVSLCCQVVFTEEPSSDEIVEAAVSQVDDYKDSFRTARVIESIVHELFQTTNSKKELAMSRMYRLSTHVLSGTRLGRKIKETINPNMGRRRIKDFAKLMENTLKEASLPKDSRVRVVLTGKAVPRGDLPGRIQAISSHSHETTMFLIEDVVTRLAKDGDLIKE